MDRRSKEDLIDEIEEDDVNGALDLLESFHINIDDVEDVQAAQQRFWRHLALEQANKKQLRTSKWQEKRSWTSANSREVIHRLIEQNADASERLQEMVGDVTEFVRTLPEKRKVDLHDAFPHVEQDLEGVQDQLYSDQCVILIAGETSAGKSTLLNLLLGQLGECLVPVAHTGTTSVITELKYGVEKKMVAHPRSTEDKPIECKLGNNAAEVLSKHIFQKGDRDTSFKYNRVEIYWPSDFLQKGITVVDTPGVGEDEELTEMVKQYLCKAFAFIYVINTPNAGGIDPDRLQDLIFSHLCKQQDTSGLFNPRTAMFVCNKWDQVPVDDRDQVKEYVMDKLQTTWPGFKDDQVFFFSAKRTIEQLKEGFISSQYSSLLWGIENLIPVGLKAKLAAQYKVISDILERSNFILQSFIRESEFSAETYNKAKEKLEMLEKEPAKIKQELQDKIDKDIDRSIEELNGHLQSPQTLLHLCKWNRGDCPVDNNRSRLIDKMTGRVLKRIRNEITEWEKRHRTFDQINEDITSRFKSRFLAIENELKTVEAGFIDSNELEEEEDDMVKGYKSVTEENNRLSRSNKIVLGITAPVWIPAGIVIGIVALPVLIPALAGLSIFRKVRDNRVVKNTLENMEDKMSEMTREVIKKFTSDGMVKEIIVGQINDLKNKFYVLFDRIPELIQADKRMLEKMKNELQGNVEDLRSNYYPILMTGTRYRSALDHLYLSDLRSYDIMLNELNGLELIRNGSYAKIYKGKWQNAATGDVLEVAVKRLRFPVTEMNATDFIKEEQSLRKLKNPHILEFHGTCIAGEADIFSPLLVMELCQDTLDHVINSKNYLAPYQHNDTHKYPFALTMASKYAYQICRGLLAFHNKGVSYGNLKPENILVSTKGVVKLAHMGTAERICCMAHSRCGTHLYMAPEVFTEKTHDEKADIFCLATIMYELWYGHRATVQVRNFNYSNNIELFLKSPFPNNEEPDEIWRDVMIQCWSINPENRLTAKQCCATISAVYMKDDPFRHEQA